MAEARALKLCTKEDYIVSDVTHFFCPTGVYYYLFQLGAFFKSYFYDITKPDISAFILKLAAAIAAVMSHLGG